MENYKELLTALYKEHAPEKLDQIDFYLDKYKGNKSAEEFVKYEKHGAELYSKYKEYYGYVFYISLMI